MNGDVMVAVMEVLHGPENSDLARLMAIAEFPTFHLQIPKLSL